MTVLLGIKESDLDKWMVNNKLVLDKYCNITISDGQNNEEYEFHLDYDIIITRSVSNDTNVYSAVYNMDRKNTLSDIDNPYLKQPYRLNINGVIYVILQCKIRQVAITKNYRQLISSNIIDNKTFNFEFEDQLADFEVIIKENGKTYYLTPVFEGSGIDSNIEYYCSYMYINDNMVRVKFNSESYMPSLNAEIVTIVKTTKGSAAVFECTESLIVVFASNDYDEVISFKSYLYTKIVRFLLLQAVVSQDVIRSSYCFVPALEKYEGKYTDERLRKEWNISETDWQYIDSRIKAIEEMGK